MAQYIAVTPPMPVVPTSDRNYLRSDLTTYERACVGQWPAERIAEHRGGLEKGRVWQGKKLARAFVRNSNVVAALGQRIAPWIGCAHQVSGSDEELALLAPMLKGNLTADTVIDIATDLTMVGLAILHHPYVPSTDGSVWNPVVKVWDLEAVEYDSFEKAYFTWTRERGRVRITHGDGVWTIVRSHKNIPHAYGAVIPLAMAVASNTTSTIDQNQTSNAIRAPKLIGKLPPGVPVDNPIGKELKSALLTLMQGLSVGVVSNATEVDKIEFNASGIGQFYDVTSKLSREDIFRALIWEPATANSSGGNYVKEAGMQQTIYQCVKADVTLAGDAITSGLVRPFLFYNRGITESSAKVFYPLPDPDEDARIKSYGERQDKLIAILEARRKAGFTVLQRDVDVLARDLGIEAPTLADAGTEKELYAYHQRGNLFTRDEIRKSRGFAPLGGEKGNELINDLAQSTADQNA